MICQKLAEVSAHDTRRTDRVLSTEAEGMAAVRAKLAFFKQSHKLDEP